MKKSTKIIFLGLLSSITLIVTCIYFKYDMVVNDKNNGTNSKLIADINTIAPIIIKPKAIETKELPIEKIVEEPKVEAKKVELKTLEVSSLDYKIEKDLITIDGKMPILENNDTLKLMLMSRCEKIKCDKKINFSSKQVDPKWKELATDTINLFHTENMEMANLIVEGNDIRISGEFKDKESIAKLEKVIKPYLVIYNIKNETTLKEVKVENSKLETPIEVEAPILKTPKIETSKIETPKLDSKNSSMKIVEEKISDILKEKHVNFYKNRAKITKKGQKTLDEIIVILKKHKDIYIEVHGHTDASGRAKTNQWISTERAKSVKNYLVSRGLNSKNIVAKGFGETKLLLKNRPNNAINRRVEIKIKRR